jgi:hypothetical protein
MMDMKNAIALALVWFFLAPMPYGIALNHQTKECGSYWGGDEFAIYHLPPEWKVYYPGDGGLIQMEVGSCSLRDGVQSCCKQLGYTYVPGNIGEVRGILLWTEVSYLYLCLRWGPFVAIALVVFLILVYLARKTNPQPVSIPTEVADRAGELNEQAGTVSKQGGDQ